MSADGMGCDKKLAVVIDDDPETQHLMIRALARFDINARGFLDGESALAFLESNPSPDLIVLDVLLPRMTGFELGRRIREHPRLAVVPLLVTTARAHLQDHELALELRAAFLAKPFRMKDYLASLERLMSHPPREKPALVMLVDDDADILKALVGIFHEEGYETITAMNGVEALYRVKGGVRPDLIVLDLMMPHMDGIELAHKMRADPNLRSLPIMLLSADNQVPARARELNALTHMKKPVEMAELLDLVARAIRFNETAPSA